MNREKKKSGLRGGGKRLFATAFVLSFLCGCPQLAQFAERAPLEDGLYLEYDLEGTSYTIIFNKVSEDKFKITYEYGFDSESEDEYGEWEEEYGEEDEEEEYDEGITVDRQLKTEKGFAYDDPELGVLWTPPSSIKKGGSVSGAIFTDVKQWEGWEVGEAKAGIGQGAIVWVWYYDKKTGFLVGGSVTLVSDEGDGTDFVLTDTSLKELMR